MGAVCFGVALWEQTASRQPEEVQSLKRKEVGAGEQEIWLDLDTGEHLGAYSYPVTVEEQKLTESEGKERFREAGRELENLILGENASLEEISSDLYLPQKLQGGALAVSYAFEPYELVDTDGTILWGQS